MCTSYQVPELKLKLIVNVEKLMLHIFRDQMKIPIIIKLDLS